MLYNNKKKSCITLHPFILVAEKTLMCKQWSTRKHIRGFEFLSKTTWEHFLLVARGTNRQEWK